MYNPKRSMYINKKFDYITSARIVEYDIKSAGFNILINAGVLDQKTINKLNSLEKHERHIQIGLLQKKNKEYNKIINDGLEKFRLLFIEANDIKEENILSVKKDALFIINKNIKYTKFENIEFRCKNKYSSYYRIRSIVEFYYNKRENKLDIKGINSNKEFIKLHKNYMIKFLKKLFSLNEINKNSSLEYLFDFSYKYCNRKLDINYYREFNSKSLYRLNFKPLGGLDLATDLEFEKDMINITYNYNYIIMPLLKLIY